MRARRPIVNPACISSHEFEGYPDYTCVWDVEVSDQGDVYASLCTEGMPAGLNARLFRMPAGSDKLVECVSNRRITCQDPSTGQMPHSKIHTSMQLDTDGKLYYITYTTSPGLGHEFWDVFQLLDDPVQGYTGSHFAEYDTLTGRYATWGTPVPRHMIYGGILDSQRRRYYYLVWILGRLGYVDLDERRFVDLGRVCRRHSFAMFMDRHGRVFGITREGQLWRYDPAANRTELLRQWLPRRDPNEPLEMYIYEVNTREDGLVVGGCRSGLPLWTYDPYDGPEGKVQSLGNPWPDLPDGSFDTAWAPLLGKDGFLYFWTKTVLGEDVHLVRMNIQTGERLDLGLGYVNNKCLGTWLGPGTVGPDGKLYWADSAYHRPSVLVVDPSKLNESLDPVEADVELPEAVPVPTGAPITVHPVDAAWTDQAVPRDRLRVIPLCDHAAPYRSCAVASLACASDGRVLAVTSGESCRLVSYDRANDNTVQLYDTGINGTAYHSLSVSPNGRALFAVDPSDPAIPAPILRLEADGDVHPVCTIPDGIRTLLTDWNLGVTYILTTRTNKLIGIDADGRRILETDSICERQLSPTLDLDSDGTLYGAQRGGRIWRLKPGSAEIETLDLGIPCLKGRAYLVEWQAAASSHDVIYGSTSDGYLFRFDPSAVRLVNLGKPVIEMGLRALTAAPDGSIYGAGGAPEYGIPHVFRYHPETGFEDIGHLDYLLHPYGFAVRVACMTTSPDGAIYIGEDDDISHLWEFRPI